MPIEPITAVCAAVCGGMALLLWPRRADTGVAFTCATIVAVSGALVLRAVQGDNLAGLGASFALLQLAPLFLFAGVHDNLRHQVQSSLSGCTPG